MPQLSHNLKAPAPLLEDFPADIRPWLIPDYTGDVVYECIDCGSCYRIDQFLYTCPQCRSLLRLRNRDFASLKKIPGALWQKIFDYRKLLRTESLQGIFLFKEILFPTIPLQDIIYLGEGHTALVRANPELSGRAGLDFFVKNDGFNPSASFKDRGMASAVSFINYSIRTRGLKEVLGICASTGDTSAAAALYLSYLDKQVVKSVVLLPQGRVTPQQLSQPLGSGALVIEIPGVFDDCMKIVEELAENYQVCLLNSKNPIRIMGQKSYAYEIAQQLCYNTRDLVVVVPIGNAGNVTAIMEGFLDLYDLNIIPELPCILGVQSTHANPVVQWQESGRYQPMKVQPSVAQAAMIGDPVSFPKVQNLVRDHFQERFMAVAVEEQQIIESMLEANRYGHVVCTQGGEALAGLKKAVSLGLVKKSQTVVVDSTSHQLKFSNFQQLYFDNAYPPAYEITPRQQYINKPVVLDACAEGIAQFLKLKKKLKE
ncbi:MAG: threonine synthase [Proteobacteria bacterium]|nr:threonine synthase [Pseudomonadota bacterium]